MGRLFVILTFLLPATCIAQSQSLTVDDLVNLSAVSPQNFDALIVKKSFSVKRRSIVENEMGYTFFESKTPGDSSHANRSINVYKKGDTWCIAFHTSSIDEYINGRNRLKKLNFFSEAGSDSSLKAPLLFQKKAITIEATCDLQGEEPVYTFLMKKKDIPDPSSVQYAEDLLKFDSHEYLVACFGEDNVKRDVYVFSENESKKCSILFPNSNEQAVFIWDDENNYRKLSYIAITGTLSTPATAQYTGSYGHNKWELKNGIYQGMRLSDLLRLNSHDFEFYGNKSEFSMMVEPKVTGSINFKFIGIGFNCFNCDRAALLDKQKVNASEAVDNNLAMHVSCIMISP
jgi:hypothetical protein